MLLFFVHNLQNEASEEHKSFKKTKTKLQTDACNTTESPHQFTGFYSPRLLHLSPSVSSVPSSAPVPGLKSLWASYTTTDVKEMLTRAVNTIQKQRKRI